MTGRAIWNNEVEKAKESISDGMSNDCSARERSLFFWRISQNSAGKLSLRYLQHDLTDGERDGKKIRRAEERAQLAEEASVSKTSKSKSFVNRSFSSSYSLFACPRAQANSSNSERRLCLVRPMAFLNLAVVSLVAILVIGGPGASLSLRRTRMLDDLPRMRKVSQFILAFTCKRVYSHYSKTSIGRYLC